MKFATVDEFREEFDRIFALIDKGEDFVITDHGKPIATVSPMNSHDAPNDPALRPEKDAWADIDAALSQSDPAYPHWEDALQHSRRRPNAP